MKGPTLRREMPAKPCLFLVHISSFVPDWAVDLFVEWRATGGELAHFVVLGTHEGGTVAKRPAYPLAVQPAVLLDLLGEIRLWERGPADAHQCDATVTQICGTG